MQKTVGVLACVLGWWSSLAAAGELLVKAGRPKSEIVVAETAARTTLLAARELQTYVRKISGAELRILTRPSGKVPVEIFVGASRYTAERGIAVHDLLYGAYRIVSGDDWLALVGQDTNFTPIDPWPRSNADRVNGSVLRAWDAVTGAHWGCPVWHLYKYYAGPGRLFGKPDAPLADKQGNVYFWDFDERGSFNAVCGFLRSLGVRWYMPGEIGEVLPRMASIPLPKINQTVRPDFAVRRFCFRFGVHNRDIPMWAMHLGLRDEYGFENAHGMAHMTRRPEFMKAHPDWFALYAGKRQNRPGQRHNHLCYSSEGLLRETVHYVRTVLDHYKFKAVSVMPPDGYTAICQCPLCKGKDTPERGYRGRLSDYVWDFVNRVAKEVRKTHPNKLVTCCAYGAYTLPPLKIRKLEPNVQVFIVGGRRPTAVRSEQREEIRRLRQGWLEKTDRPILIFENYPFTGRGWYLPAFVYHTIGESVNATKGVSMGEDIWLTVRRDFDKVGIGFNHFLVYFTARMYWGGKQQSVEKLFDEYCHLFYGPASAEMKAFFDYCEAHWTEMEKKKEPADRALELFARAQKKVEPKSVYARRLALMDEFLSGLRNKRRQLGQKRGPVPQYRLLDRASGIVIDGKLDDAFWRQCTRVGRLRELQTGRRPFLGTTFKAAWGRGGIYFAIRCEERPGDRVNIGTTRNGDTALWYGDAVEILLETDAHAYYQIAVCPSGAHVDLDRGAPKSKWYSWNSQAQIATQIGDDHWTIEAYIPVVENTNDPLHQVVGHKPTPSLPWFFNVCRQRIRETGEEYSAFSPTGKKAFHVPLKFAHLYIGLSRRFEAGPARGDCVLDRNAALALMRQRKYDEALNAFLTLAEGDVTPFQKSDALEQAVATALARKDPARAMDLASKIPIDAAAKCARVRILFAMRKPGEVVKQFAGEDIGRWPFWKVGEGYSLRGRAYSETGRGVQAEADLLNAEKWTTDPQALGEIWLALGRNREVNLKNPERALDAYQRIASATTIHGGWRYFRGILGAARILREQGKFKEALKTLHRVDMAKLRGYWHGRMYRFLGDTLNAAGRRTDALAAYREVLKAPGMSTADRKAAAAALGVLEGAGK